MKLEGHGQRPAPRPGSPETRHFAGPRVGVGENAVSKTFGTFYKGVR